MEIKKGTKVKYPSFGGNGWAKVVRVDPCTGLAEIKYPDTKYTIEVKTKELITI
jgi:hypothetical protein